MSYPQDPNQPSNQPYGQPGQDPFGQTPYGQTPYGQPNIGPFAQPENPYGGGQQQQPYGQPNIGPFAQPENPFGTSGGQTQQPFDQPPSPYGNAGGVSQQSFEPYGQQQQYGAPPLPPGYPQQQFYGGQPPAGGGKGKGGIIALIVVAVVVALGVGGYLAFGKTNKITPVASPTGVQQQVTAPAGSSSAPGGAGTGAPTSAPGAVVPPAGSFNPPASYSSNSLSDDNGCGDYAAAAAAFLVSTFEISGSSDASSALTTLAGSLKSASSDAQDPTLASALTAETSFVQQNIAALTPPLVDYGTNFSASSFDTAAQAIQSTDDYINGVCGTASWIPSD